MTQDNLFNSLDELKSLKPLKKAEQLKTIVNNFSNDIDSYTDDKNEAVKRLQKVVYTLRMELAFNKATESNTGKLDKELDILSKSLNNLLD